MATSSKLHVTLLTGRTIEQGVGKECGKMSDEYRESVSVCFIDSDDLKRLGVTEETSVRVSTPYGSVVLKAAKSPTSPHPSVIFIPYGPWANVVIDAATDNLGMPSLKGISAEIEPAPEEPVLDLSKLLARHFRNE